MAFTKKLIIINLNFSKMSNSPEQYLDFFNFPESDSSLNFRGYNGYAEDESLF